MGWDTAPNADSTENVVIGAEAASGDANSASQGNVILGARAARAAFNGGIQNIIIGYQAGVSMNNGTFNTIIGANADAAVSVSSGIAIGYGATVNNANSIVIGSDSSDGQVTDMWVGRGDQDSAEPEVSNAHSRGAAGIGVAEVCLWDWSVGWP